MFISKSRNTYKTIIRKVTGMFEDLKNYKFREVGNRFDTEDERTKFIADRIHILSWKYKKDIDV